MRLKSFVLGVLLLLGGRVWGQDGSLDTTFVPPGTGFNSDVYSVGIQPDNKIIAGGFFSSFNGRVCNSLTRLNNIGNIDTTFELGTGFNSSVHAISIQADGKIIAGGDFSSYNGLPRGRIARLNIDGALDSGFQTQGTGFDSWVYSVKALSSGKVMVGGLFTNYNSVTRNHIACLNQDGSLDTSFNSGTGLNGQVYAFVEQNDGKIIAGGAFVTYNGTQRWNIVRINRNGFIDTTFKTNPGFNGIVNSVAIQADGKVVVGGNFTYYDATICNYIARLNQNGSLDTNFRPGLGFDYWVQTIAIQPNSKILVGGYFSTFDGIEKKNIARLNSDGSLDDTFIASTGHINDQRVMSLSLDQNGKIIVGGRFTVFDSTNRNYIARLNNTSLLTSSFQSYPLHFITLSPNPAHHTATLTAAQPLRAVRVVGMDGKVVRTLPGGAGTVEVDLRGVAPGMYSVEGVGVDGRVSRQRLVVE